MKKWGVFPLRYSRVALHLACIYFIADLILPLASNHFENHVLSAHTAGAKRKRQVPDIQVGKVSWKRQEGRHLH